MKLFNPDTPIMQKLQEMAMAVCCGFFWLLLCIPVITAGASTTAMYRMMFNLREDKPARIGEFFRVFKREFGKSTLILLIQLGSGALVFLLFRIINLYVPEGILQFLFFAVFIVLLLGWLFTFQLAYPLTAYFNNTIRNTLKNALLMSLRHRRQSVPIVALAFLPITYCLLTSMYMWGLFYYTVFCILPVWIFVFIPLLVYRQSYHLLLIFENYITDTDPAEESKGN